MLTVQTTRRSVPVTLSEIPLPVRLRAARLARNACRDDQERRDLLLAALMPSDVTYFVSPDAAPLLNQWRAA